MRIIPIGLCTLKSHPQITRLIEIDPSFEGAVQRGKQNKVYTGDKLRLPCCISYCTIQVLYNPMCHEQDGSSLSWQHGQE